MSKGNLEFDSVGWYVKLTGLFYAVAISRLDLATQTLRVRFDHREKV